MNQLNIKTCAVIDDLPSDLREFIHKHKVRLELVQVFKHRPPMWAITSSKYNMHRGDQVDMHNKILNTINGVG